MKKNYTFRIVIDSDVQKEHPTSDIEFLIVVYLNDPEGWTSKGYTFDQVSSNEDVLIRVSSPTTIHKKCGLPNDLSCAELGGHNMYLNSKRWFQGSSKSQLDLENYRQYMVSHEIGHILGFEHEKCPCPNCKAPIMLQQTRGIGKCIPNTKVTNGDRKEPH